MELLFRSLLLLALSIGQYSNFNHNRFNALVCAKGENKYGKENALQIYREQSRVTRLVTGLSISNRQLATSSLVQDRRFKCSQICHQTFISTS